MSETETSLHMKFFPTPEIKAEKKLADARASRDALAARLVAAQSAVVQSSTALHQLAVQGAEDAALAAGEAKLRDTERRVSTLAPALAETEKLLVSLEADRVETLDKKTRAATATMTNELADELVEVAGAHDTTTAALHEVCSRALLISMESQGLVIFTASSRIEVAAAAEVVATCLREHGRAVLNRLAPAEMPRPTPPVIEPVAKPVAEPEAAKPASPPVFHRVDRPHYQMRFAGRGAS
jgi:hypothetical protein